MLSQGETSEAPAAQEATPVLSRRTIRADMAARGLRPAADLAQGKPCGTRLRYYAGCRCQACRAANAAYERMRIEARRRGEPNGLVIAERARAHLAWLSSRGVGRKTAADAAKVAASIVSKVVDGERKRIRAQTEARILAVTEHAAADRAYVDGTETHRRLRELIACGYPKSRIASEILGRPVRSLQIDARKVTARNAERVRRVYERLRLASVAVTRLAEKRLAELREEGIRREQALRDMAALAQRRGWPAPTLELGKRGKGIGRLRQQEVELIEAVHHALLGEDLA